MRALRLRKLNLSVFKDYFGLITVATFALGYIGFYTYTAKYSLAFVHPEVSQVVAIGIATIILLFSFYLSSGGSLKRTARSLRSLIVLFFVVVICQQLNPLILFVATYAYIDRGDLLFGGDLPRSFAKRRKQLQRLPKVHRLWNFFVTLGFFIIAAFYSIQIFIMWAFIDTAVRVFRLLRFNIIEGYKIFLVVLLTPIFFFAFLITDQDVTLLGLSAPNIIITKKDNSIVKGKLVFKDNDFFYLQDTLSVPFQQLRNIFAPEIGTSVNIAKDEISNYRVDTTAIKEKTNKSVIELFRRIK